MFPQSTLLCTLLCGGLLCTTFVFADTGRIEGFVKEGNNPLDEVTVSAAPQENQKTPKSEKTDKKGGYKFNAIEIGAYKLRYWKRGYKAAYRDVRVTTYPPVTKVDDVVLLPAGSGSVTGQVVDTKGNPVKTAQVQALSADSGDTFKPDLNGSGGFNFNNIPEGTYQLTASALGYLNAAAGVEVEANKTKSVQLILTPNPAPPIARNVVASPRRPGIAESAEPLQDTRLQIESGLNYGTFDLFDQDLVLSLGFRYSVTSRFFLMGGLEQELSAEPTRGTVRSTQLRVQYLFVKDSTRGLAVAYGIKVPALRNGEVNTRRLEHRITALSSAKFGPYLVDLNASLDILSKDSDRNYSLSSATSVQRDLTPKVGLFSEVSFERKHPFLARRWMMLSGLNYRLNSRIILDGGMRVVHDPGQTRFQIFSGLAIAM